MLLFRRRPRDKDGPVDDRPETSGAPPTPSTGPEPAPTRTPPPSASSPPSPPPPLPQRVPGTGSEPPALAPLSRCFVCGSVLEAGRCPSCRITWVE